jgi:hypothetical protein
LWDRARDLPEFEKEFPSLQLMLTPRSVAHCGHYRVSLGLFLFSHGVRFPILHFEFAIDTGSLLFAKPHYGPYESKIIMEQIQFYWTMVSSKLR